MGEANYRAFWSISGQTDGRMGVNNDTNTSSLSMAFLCFLFLEHSQCLSL